MKFDRIKPSTEKENETAMVLGAGQYVFGENLPLGRYDLRVISGSGSLVIDAQDHTGKWKDTTFVVLGTDKGCATAYRGLSLPEGKKFLVNGDVLFEITRAEVIRID